MANLKRTREDILVAVIDTIHQKGLTSTGLSELFAISGASSGSFYNYFQSKQDLGHAVIDFEWAKLRTYILDLAQNEVAHPVQRIFWILDRLEQKQLEDPKWAGCLLGNLVVDLVEQDPSFKDHLQQVFEQWVGAIATILQDAAPDLQPDTSPGMLAQQIIVVVEGAMLMGKLYRTPEQVHLGFDTARQILRSALQSPDLPENLPRQDPPACVSHRCE